MAYRLTGGTWSMHVDGKNVYNGEEIHDPLVDRVPLAVAVLQHILFQAVSNDTREGVVVSDADTNNNAPKGTVPQNEKWELWAVTFMYLAVATRTDANVQAILDMIRQTTLSLVINPTKQMFFHPLWRYLKGIQAIQVPGANFSRVVSQSNFVMKWDLEVPIVLEAGAVWKGVVTHLTAVAAGLAGDFIAFELDRKRIMAT